MHKSISGYGKRKKYVYRIKFEGKAGFFFADDSKSEVEQQDIKINVNSMEIN